MQCHFAGARIKIICFAIYNMPWKVHVVLTMLSAVAGVHGTNAFAVLSLHLNSGPVL